MWKTHFRDRVFFYTQVFFLLEFFFKVSVVDGLLMTIRISAAPFWSFIMDFQRLGTMIYLYTKPDIDLGIGWTSYITVHLILRMIIMYCKVPAIKAVSWTGEPVKKPN